MLVTLDLVILSVTTLLLGITQRTYAAFSSANSSQIRDWNTFRYRDYPAVSSVIAKFQSDPDSNALCSPPIFKVRTRSRINPNAIPKPLAYKSSAYFPVLTELDLSRCFIRFTETRLTAVTPMFAAETGNLEECLSMCLASEANEYPGDCESVVYYPNIRECELYGVTGRSDDVTVTMQYGIDYYELTNCPGCLINDPVGVTFHPLMRHKRTTTPVPTTPLTTSTTTTTTTTTTTKTTPKPTTTTTTKAPTTTTTTKVSTTTTLSYPVGTKCEDQGKTTVLQQSKEFILDDQNSVAKFTANSPIQCSSACRDNKQPDGKIIFCLSANYVAASKRCVIYKDRATSPVGTPGLIASPGGSYYEKTCLDPDVAQRCGTNLVDRRKQISLKVTEFLLSADTTATSSTQCITNCLSYTRFTCKSAMYTVGQQQSSNCLLANAAATPLNSVPSTAGQVEYYGFDACTGKLGVLSNQQEETVIESPYLRLWNIIGKSHKWN